MFLDMSFSLADFCCIVLPKLLNPVADKNKISSPVFCIESLAIQPTPSNTSTKVRVFTSKLP